MVEIKIKAIKKTWNTVYQCIFCKGWKNAVKEGPMVIQIFKGAPLGPKQEIVLSLEVATCCKECFETQVKQIGLENEEPKIFVPQL